MNESYKKANKFLKLENSKEALHKALRCVIVAIKEQDDELVIEAGGSPFCMKI